MTRKLCCAIYTRKSTEEGLDQEFNSLDAQREACEAYILSQRQEGWQCLETRYDDGGLSGGTLDRPALTRLLDDVREGKVDQIVVYKIDRLTRSLSDFSKIVDVLDAVGVSFVSVTQSFNTATSMGRLTLNMLLSFAQFEREVTAERIRDKIAASKRKGLWMGGTPPIGYQVEDRKLVVDKAQATTVRRIFERYLSLGSVRLLQGEMKRDGIVTPIRISGAGRRSGGSVFSRGKLYAILSNPIYIGKVRHRGKVYDGQQDAIIDIDFWDRVQAKLEANRFAYHKRADARQTSSLAGCIFDPEGQKMRPVHTTKNTKRYRYYVSPGLVESSIEAGSHGWRIPAQEVEEALAKVVVKALKDPKTIATLISAAPSREADMQRKLDRISRELHLPLSKRGVAMLQSIIARVDLREDSLSARIDLTAAIEEATAKPVAHIAPLELQGPIRVARRGGALKLILNDASVKEAIPDPNLVQLLLDNRRRNKAYLNPDAPKTISQIADQEGIDTGDVSRSMQLAFLAPDIVRAILNGCQPVELTSTKLARLERLPLLWEDQRAALNMSS